VVGACGSTTTGAGDLAARAGGSTTTVASTQAVSIIDPPTTIIDYPNPYHPSYATVAALANDSAYIVIATVESEDPTRGGYGLNVEISLGTTSPRVLIGIVTAEFDAAHLTVGGDYIFFYGIDPIDNSACIVGGVRGVFAYDASSQTVTRIDRSMPSQIPNTQTLAQLEAALRASEQAHVGQPMANIPPLCESTATRL